MSAAVTPEGKRRALAAILKALPGNSCTMQCARLRAALSSHPISTFEAARFLDCYYAPARIMELRRAGARIVTAWCLAETESGEKHRVGNYLWVAKP